MGCGVVTLKSCIGLISLFFWMCAVTLIVIGALILGEYGHIDELANSTDVLVPSSILIGAGVFLFIVGLLGCVGGMKGNKVALTLFFILTLIVMVGEVVAIAFGYEYRGMAEDKLKTKLHGMIHNCANFSTNVTDRSSDVDCNELDFLQSKFKCCGADSYKDWYKYSTGMFPIPQSCCREVNCKTPESGTTNKTIVDELIYSEGCSTKAVDLFLDYFSWIFVGTIVIVILQVLGLVSTCIMLFRSQETPYLSLDGQGYRV